LTLQVLLHDFCNAHRSKQAAAPPLGEWFRNELRDLLLDTLGPTQHRLSDHRRLAKRHAR